jgi:signal transduction histidine kinase/DNA-binding response OmpR family regulator
MTRPRVLIVEDELVVGLDLEHRLAEMGYQVVAVAPTGREALDEVSRCPPDLVLMDIKLDGDLDGIEVARRIRGGLDVPIVFVTAFADEATTQRVKGVAPYGYVVKPFQKEALRAVIETALTRHAMEARLQQSERSLRRANDREHALRTRLESIDRAASAVARALANLGSDVRPFLHAVAEEARSLAGAECAALGVVTELRRPFDPWVCAGVDDAAARALGRTPGAVGGLGDVVGVEPVCRPPDPGDARGRAGFPAGQPAMTSFLTIPIHYRGEGRGNLYLANKQGGQEFTAEDEASVRMLADRVGIALEIARLHEIEARERARLEFLARAGTSLAGSLDLDTTLAAIGDLIVPAVADRCTIDLLDEVGDRQRVLTRPATGAAGSGGDDIAVPLSLRGRVLGNLDVSVASAQRGRCGDDLPFLQEIAQLAALALENARLHHATEQSEREQRFLSDLGATLASSLDYHETLSAAARIAVRDLADWCLLDLVDADGRVHRLEVVHADPAKASCCEALKQIQVGPERSYLASPVLHAGRPTLMREVSRAYLESIGEHEDHLRLILDLDTRSMIALPLRVRGRLLGGLILGSSRPSRRYGSRDLAFAEHAAHRIALAIDNAELYGIARRASQARDEVLGIVAHDLRNPLNNVLLQVELLRRHQPELLSPKPLELIHRAAQRMNRMIQELLDVARLDAGKFAVTPGPVSAAEVIAEAVDGQRPFATGALLDLAVDVAGSLPELWGDRDFLGQVFDNLIGNAIKFTKPGGRITVGASARGPGVRLWVTDTGIGIPEADRPHLFDRFWQARRADRRGAGLGLSIVKGIVEAHGGHVWVETATGRGTTVSFTIPVAPQLAGCASEAPPPARPQLEGWAPEAPPPRR